MSRVVRSASTAKFVVKRWTREMGDSYWIRWLRVNIDKPEELIAFFTLIFTSKVSQASRPGIHGRVRVTISGWVRDCSGKLDLYKQVHGTRRAVTKDAGRDDRYHSKATFYHFWEAMDTPTNWRNVAPIFKKHSKNSSENCMLSSLTSVHGKKINQIILHGISGHAKEK